MVRARLFAAGVVLAAAACSSDTSTPPATNDLVVTSDVAMAAADGVAEDVDVMTGMNGNIGNLSMGAGGSYANGMGSWRPGLSGCTFAAGSFTCPDTLRNGLNVTRVVTLLDASGATQSAYDSLLTASIHIVADISGDRTHGPWSATVARHRDITVTGLAGTETSRTVNGTGNETVSQSRVTASGGTRSYTMTGASTITNVVMPVRSADGGNGWPVSGTITRTMTITLTSGPNAGKTETRTMTVTFDGTSTPSGSIDGHTFTINCANHTATPRT